MFDKIVLDGLYKDLGMVGWAKYLSTEDTHAIHAYVIERAHETQREQDGGWLQAVKNWGYGVLAKLIAWFITLTA